MSGDIYIKIATADEVLTEGACTRESVGGFYKEDHEEEAIVLSLEHLMNAPRDSRSGQVTGSIRHKYLKISKLIDKCSPLLVASLVSPEDLEVEIFFCRLGESGEMEPYYIITLEQARIISINSKSPDYLKAGDEKKLSQEEVIFAYNKIEWEHVQASTTAADDASGR